MTNDAAPHPVAYEKALSGHQENLKVFEDVTQIADRGHTATDQYGRALFKFDAKAESKLRWKIDLYIMPTVALLYLFCFIDRANIGTLCVTLAKPQHVTHAIHTTGNARLAGFDYDLSLSGYDYNHVLSVFYISYIIFEIPCNLCCKWMGPGWFLPVSTVLFGVTSIATAFVNTIHQASGVRFVLGVFEAGMVSALLLFGYVSRPLAFGHRHNARMESNFSPIAMNTSTDCFESCPALHTIYLAGTDAASWLSGSHCTS